MVILLVVIHWLLLPLYVCGGGDWSLFYNVIVNVLSNLAIISLRKRELAALL